MMCAMATEGFEQIRGWLTAVADGALDDPDAFLPNGWKGLIEPIWRPDDLQWTVDLIRGSLGKALFPPKHPTGMDNDDALLARALFELGRDQDALDALKPLNFLWGEVPKNAPYWWLQIRHLAEGRLAASAGNSQQALTSFLNAVRNPHPGRYSDPDYLLRGLHQLATLDMSGLAHAPTRGQWAHLALAVNDGLRKWSKPKGWSPPAGYVDTEVDELVLTALLGGDAAPEKGQPTVAPMSDHDGDVTKVPGATPAASGQAVEGTVPTHKSQAAGSPILSVDDFNIRLFDWLEGTRGRTIGASDLRGTRVRIGNTVCLLADDTTRAGVSAYVARLKADGGVRYSVVPSSEGVARRVVPGRTPERIPGFYLYSHKLFEDPQIIRPVSAPLDLWSIGMLILDAVAELHQRGHQRLRLYPNMSGSGMHWRTRLVDVDTARFSEWGWPEWDGASFAYSTGSRFNVGGMLVDASTTAAEVADRILAAFPEPLRAGVGRDWLYAGWYCEMLGSARQHHNLPIGDEPKTVNGRRHWPFVPEAGNSIEAPPPPTRGDSRR
jgi:hypothetical protein